jgi:hypothetical protein
MILRLFRPRFHPGTIHTLYGAIVAQARRPEIYQEFGAADTVEGRFDMIVLHLVLVLRRLEREPQGAALGLALLDAFGRDMDHNLREMGDLAVPKQMKRMMEAFQGRARSYAGAPGPIRRRWSGRWHAMCSVARPRAQRGSPPMCAVPPGNWMRREARNSCAAGLFFPIPAPFWPAMPIQPELMALRISA